MNRFFVTRCGADKIQYKSSCGHLVELTLEEATDLCANLQVATAQVTRSANVQKFIDQHKAKERP